MPPKKVLLAGSVRGKFDTLFKRAAAVHKANGPFDLLLCAGQFFDPDTPSAGLEDYIDGSKAAPIPTYFTIAASSAEEIQAQELAGSSADIHCLGHAGVQKIEGLLIAYFNAQAADAKDVPAGSAAQGMREVKDSVEKASGDIDIFLTAAWPAGITQGTAPNALPAGAELPGSTVEAEMAGMVRPRYHVASDRDVFFARAPYLNRDLGAGAHVTRFVGLASLGNAAKAKALHALALVPAADMDLATLHQKPDGTTPSPYHIASNAKRPLPGSDRPENGLDQPWRWQQSKRAAPDSIGPSLGRTGVVRDDRHTVYAGNLPFRATEADLEAFFAAAGHVVDIRRSADDAGKLRAFGFIQYQNEEDADRACKLLQGAELMGREITVNHAGTANGTAQGQPSGAPVEGCWFCLSNSSADTHLIASVGEEAYVAVDKGPITPDHALVLSIEHFPSQLAVPASTYSEIERYLDALATCFAAQGRDIVAFERYMTFRKSGGNHCQINVLPVPRAAATRAEAAFQTAASTAGITLVCLPPGPKGEMAREALREVVGSGEFFVATLPNGLRMVHAITRGERHPLNFGREVLAGLAGMPDRVDWKSCVDGSRGMEEARTAQFKQAFKAYDIMQ